MVQCITIENRQSPFYVVNRVTFTGKNYIKYLASPLNRQYVCWEGLDLSKEILWDSVSQLAAKLQAVKVGGLKKVMPPDPPQTTWVQPWFNSLTIESSSSFDSL